LKIPWYWLISLGLLLIAATVFGAFQTSLWYLVFGSFPSPMLWLVLLVYVSVTRPLWEATLTTYLLTLVNTSFTAFPFEAMLVYSLILMVTLILVRERVFWGGPTFFMLMVGAASLSAPIFFWATSRWFDRNPLFIPQVFDWMIAALLTLLASLPVYRLCQWFDRISLMDAGSEGRVGPM
jgi:hypothetical protein